MFVSTKILLKMSGSSDSVPKSDDKAKGAAAAVVKRFNTKYCECGGKCDTRLCKCYLNGRGCDESCECSSCENMFNNLEYFFGEDENCTAHPCFAKWLMNNTFGTGLEVINRNVLRDRLTHARR